MRVHGLVDLSQQMDHFLHRAGKFFMGKDTSIENLLEIRKWLVTVIRYGQVVLHRIDRELHKAGYPLNQLEM